MNVPRVTHDESLLLLLHLPPPLAILVLDLGAEVAPDDSGNDEADDAENRDAGDDDDLATC